MREAVHRASRAEVSMSECRRDEVSVTFACGVAFTNTPGNMQSCVRTSWFEMPTTPSVLHWPRAATWATVCAYPSRVAS